MTRVTPLLMILVIGIPAVSSAQVKAAEVPLYCQRPPSRGLRPEQEKQCELLDPQRVKKAEEEEKAKKAKAEQVEVKYPFIAKGAFLVEGAPPAPIDVKASSPDEIQFAYSKAKPGQADLTLKTLNVVQWLQGDFSGRRFDGGAAVTSTATMIGAAVITVATGGLGAPLMLLAAPFMGLSSGNQYVADHRVVIRYVDSDTGQIEFVTVQLFDKKAFLTVSEILKTGTGLAVSKKRGDDELKPVREKALAFQEELLRQDAMKLMVSDSRKPWCSTLDLSGKTGSTKEYNLHLENVTRLRKILLMPEYQEAASGSSDEKWDKHLDSNPGLKAWASANKGVALKLKSCG